MQLRSKVITLALGVVLASAASISAQPSAPAKPDISFRHELQHAIDRGLAFLLASQNSNGWWSSPDDPAVTALVVGAFLSEPTGKYRTNQPPELKRALKYIADSAQPDGSIQRGKLANYNTAISITALALTADPAYNEIIKKGRAFIIGVQSDYDQPGVRDSALDGGIGYGDGRRHSDLVNTLTALESLRATENVGWNTSAGNSKSEKPAKGADLNWEAAIQFIEDCQNLPKYNTQSWVSTAPKDLGGFVYNPIESKAGSDTNADSGRVSLRSYGSISYAGLLSYIYADVKGDDPRVTAVMDWLRANYTLEENPGMGEQGLYYYFHLMTKGLAAAGVDQIELKDGRKVNWRREVSMHLLNLQKPDGSWVNNNARWREKDAAMVTAYSLLSLEILWRKM
jgi:squalene-hopene/tetraprenyl-beta-curcumene cyclase